MNRIFYGFIFAGLTMAFSACGNSRGSSDRSGQSHEEAVQSVEDIERSQPAMYLQADGTYRENFLGDKMKISCTIANNASVVTFKDAVLKITFYSKTDTELGSETQTLYEEFPPQTTKTLELKVTKYDDVEKLGWEIISAVPK